MPDGVELAVAYVSLVVEGAKVRKGVNESFRATEQDATKAGKSAAKSYGASFSSTAKGALAGIGVAAGIGTAFKFLSDANAEAREAQKVGAQTAAVIKSTGGAAGLTAREFGNLANSISKYSGIDDEAIQSAENLIATFRGIRNVGSDKIFDETTRAAVDMSVALGTDARSAALQLGKALNDPTKGFSKLQRSGVTFTDSQVKQIKTLQKSGDLVGAQRVLLSELTKEFGGSAAAQATQADKTEVAIGNLKEQIGTGLLPVQDKLLRLTANEVVPALSRFAGGMEDGTGAGGKFAGALKDVYGIGKDVTGVIDGLPGPVKSLGVEAAIAYAAFSKFGPGLQTATSGVGTFVTGLKDSETRAATTSKALTGLKSAAGTAAGVGGLLALYASSKQSNEAVKTLGSVAGGALTGFAAGGPIGLALGAGAGLIAALASKTDKSTHSFKLSSDAASNYASSLDQVTGAVKENSKQQVIADLRKSGTLKLGTSAGLTQRQLVDAALGQPAAYDAVSAAIARISKNAAGLKVRYDELSRSGPLTDQQQTEYDKLGNKLATQRDQVKSLTTLVGQNANAYAAAAKQTRLDYYAKASLSTLLKGFPKQVTTQVKADAKGAYSDIGALIKRYDLTPKEVITIAGLAGDDLSRKKALGLIRTYGNVAKPRNTKFSVDDKAARAASAQLSRVFDQAAKTRYVHYQVINPSVNKPKVGAAGQTGGGSRTADRFATIAAPTASSGSRVALTITNWDEGTGYMDVVAENRTYAVLQTEGIG